MPQPLNRVIPNGEFRPKKARPNESVLNDKPELAKLVASIFELGASIEGSLSLLLVSVLGADAEPSNRDVCESPTPTNGCVGGCGEGRPVSERL